MVTAAIIGRIADAILGFVSLFLALRIILKLFGANTAAPFVNWVYETSEPLISPFRGMFPHPVLTGGFVIEFSTLFALLVYVLIGYAIGELLDFLSYNRTRYYKVEKGRR